MKTWLLVTLLAVLAAVASTYWATKEANFMPPMTVPGLIEYWGYPAEEHEVTTEDGYVLALHRIPRGAADDPQQQQQQVDRPPVLLAHCLLCSSAVFAFGPPDKSLAYMLADAGFDVWLANVRGNTWSHGHRSLDSCSNCSQYWNFGFDEAGRYDFPAQIDFILDQTGHPDLYVVGYSMGTTEYFVMLSERPEYNAKVRAGFMLGPAAFMANSVTPFTPVIELADEFFQVLESFGIYEILPSGEFYHFVSRKFCSDSSLTHEACVRAFTGLTGIQPELFNATMLAVYVDHLPAGTSTRTLAHFAQLSTQANGGRFARYDHGSKHKNLEAYGTEAPPDYDLSKVSQLIEFLHLKQVKVKLVQLLF